MARNSKVASIGPLAGAVALLVLPIGLSEAGFLKPPLAHYLIVIGIFASGLFVLCSGFVRKRFRCWIHVAPWWGILSLLIGIGVVHDQVFSPFTAETQIVFTSSFRSGYIYAYEINGTRFAAPLGLWTFIAVTNISDSPERIRRYNLDVMYGREWHTLLNMPINDTRQFYSCEQDHTNCLRFRFEGQTFDERIRNREIGRGETVQGWIFFEWPTQLRGVSTWGDARRVRFTTGTNQEFETPLAISAPDASDAARDETHYGMEVGRFNFCGVKLRTLSTSEEIGCFRPCVPSVKP